MKIRVSQRTLHKELRYFLARPRRILFNHLPKCGGSTINTYLETNYPQRLIYRINNRQPQASVKYFQALPKNQRWNYQLITGHLAHELLEYVHPETYAVTVFREPIDRIVSHYYFVKRDQQHYLHQQVIEQGINLAEYASSGLSPELTNWYTTHFSGMSVEEVAANPFKAVEAASKVIFGLYDLIGCQDDISGFANELRVICRLPEVYPNQRKNKTHQRKSVHELLESEYDAISRLNQADIELFQLIKRQIETKKSAQATSPLTMLDL